MCERGRINSIGKSRKGRSCVLSVCGLHSHGRVTTSWSSHRLPRTRTESCSRKGIPIPGTVDTIGVWVWGSRRDYYLDVQLRDFRGVVHTLRMGDVSFRGWQNLQIQVPTSVPQESNYVLQEEGLEIVKLVLWTRPQERVDEFYIYFDEIKVVTDMFRRRFDGEELADPERIEELWSGSSGN